MFYRVGLPLWRQAAKLGCPMMIRVDALEKEVLASASGLISFQLQDQYRKKIYSELRVRDSLQMALA